MQMSVEGHICSTNRSLGPAKAHEEPPEVNEILLQRLSLTHEYSNRPAQCNHLFTGAMITFVSLLTLARCTLLIAPRQTPQQGMGPFFRAPHNINNLLLIPLTKSVSNHRLSVSMNHFGAAACARWRYDMKPALFKNEYHVQVCRAI